MPETGIALDQDQADDLRELITLAAIVQEWLEYADDPVLDNLADFAYATPSTRAATRRGSPRISPASAASSARPSPALNQPEQVRTKISH